VYRRELEAYEAQTRFIIFASALQTCRALTHGGYVYDTMSNTFRWVDHDPVVEQGALMSPNPRGMLEDLAVGCVCLVVFEFVNSLFKMIQG